MSGVRQVKRSVSLSSAQLDYLTEAAYLSSDLQEIVRDAAAGPGGARLDLEADVAEQFRAAFTARLAESGFDADYVPTREGALLEDLIDAFFQEAA